MKIKVAKIALTKALYSYDRLYDYEIPEDLKETLKPGMRVIVPFGAANKDAEGMVIKITEALKNKKVKKIKEQIDDKIVLNDNMIKLAEKLKARYMCTWSDIYKSMVPPGSSIKVIRYVKLTKKKADLKKESIKTIVNLIKQNGESIEYKRLKKESEVKRFSSVIKSMKSRGLITIENTYETTVSKKKVKVIKPAMKKEEIIKLKDGKKFNNIKYIRFFDIIVQVPYIKVPDIKKQIGISDYMLNRLVKNKVASYDYIVANRSPVLNIDVNKDEKKHPTKEQKHVINEMLNLHKQNRYYPVLLHGITGSGKTEVYLQLIEHVLKKGRQVIVLVPEISLTPQTVSRFKSRFNKTGIAVFHSKLSKGERYDQWQAVLDDKINIVIGARSAVFAPLSRLGMIIIDEEHENSYKSDRTPKYNALEVAHLRCKSTDSILLLGSATPSINTYYKCEAGMMRKFELTKRATKGGLPEFEVVDMRYELEGSKFSLFAGKTKEALKRTFDEGKQAMILINRRGYSQYAICTDCGETLMCPSCSLTLKYHKSDHRLICHMCGYTEKMPNTCPGCKSKNLTVPGIGTQKAQEELKKSFPGIEILRMDMDTVGRKNAYKNILDDFKNKKANVLLGTQMIAKGHDFPNVALVVILSVDSMLYTGGFNASEKTFQLITQASGRSGRGKQKGKVILQTFNPKSDVVQFAKERDYKNFYNYEVDMRRKLDFPPFCNLGVITIQSKSDNFARNLSMRVKASVDAHYITKNIMAVLGPSKAPVEKIADRFYWRIIIKSKSLNDLIFLLSGVREDVRANVKSNNYRIGVDINPTQ